MISTVTASTAAALAALTLLLKRVVRVGVVIFRFLW